MQLNGAVLQTLFGDNSLGQGIGRTHNDQCLTARLNGGNAAKYLGAQYSAGIVPLSVLGGATVGRRKVEHVVIAHGLHHVMVEIGSLLLVVKHYQNAAAPCLTGNSAKEQGGR